MRARLFASVALFALPASACSVVVAGQLEETKDYAKDSGPGGGGSQGSTSNGTTTQACALLDRPDASNACAECIATSCEAHVEYACQADSGSKEWFRNLKDCARSPYLGTSPPGSGASFYACNRYRDAGPSIDSEDDAAKKRASEICVRDHCMQGATPACRQCYVDTVKGDTDERAPLAEDSCGSCMATGCADVLVKCCASQAMAWVRPCAYTADPENKTKCAQLGGSPDAGPNSRYNDEDNACLAELSQCFKSKCATAAACRP